MEQCSDIFISYRRAGGFTVAKLLSYMLEHAGFSVFFDLETLREGDFDKQLFSRIDQCTDFLVIIDQHAFDRTMDPEYDPEKDWLRKELAYALKNDKNVIPVRLSGADFPDHLPDDIHKVTRKHGPGYSEEYFNAFFQKLKGFLHSKPSLDATLTEEPDSAAGASIHFFTDTPCIVKETNQILGKVSVEEGTSIVLSKGRHRLTFVSQENGAHSYHHELTVSDVNYSDIIDISFDAFRKKEKEKAAAELFRKGKACYNKKEYTEAVKWYRLSAEQGNASAQNNLGYSYDHGLGVTKDYVEAVKWYRLSAEQGNVSAQNNLGYSYEHGEGVTKDYAEAVKWFRLAAEQGHAPAQNNLGYCYQHGHGVTPDYAEAVKLYRLAAEQGNKFAQYNLGYCYEHGEGVPKDYAEAVKWYRLAAEQGDSDAKRKLEKLQKEG